MRIGFDAKRYFHNQTGLGNHSRTLINGFRENFSDHEYILFDAKPPEDRDPTLNVVKRSGHLPFWRQLRISKDINKNHLDIYHGLSAELPYTRPRKTKLVVTIHDLIFLHYPEYYKTIDRIIYKHKTVNATGNADAIIVASQQTKKDLLPLMVDDDIPVHVIYQDCAPQFYIKKTSQDLTNIKTRYNLPEQYLICVSKFEKRKNHLALLKAVVNHNLSELPLVMVGQKGDTFTEVNQFIVSNNLEKQVTVLTDIPSDDLPSLYQHAFASIFPSEYEGFGIPILESLASGIPVITSKNSCMEEIAENAGIYFDPKNVESIADALIKIQNADIIQSMTNNIEHRLKHFSNQKLLKDHITLYKSL